MGGRIKMTIKFQCECGKVLMASDDQAGLEGKCPACGELITIPQAESLDMEEPEQSFSAEQFDEKETGEEESIGMKGLEDMGGGLEEEVEDLGGGLEGEVEDQHEKRNWVLSSRFAILASILVVVLVALVVFFVIRREKEPREDLVIIKKIQPQVETEKETSAPPVVARFEEEAAEPPQSKEAEPIASEITKRESIEQVSTEPPVGVETEVVPSEKEQEIVASTGVETPPAKKAPPIRAYTINVASFRKKQGAERYVEKLKKMGIDAFKWEVNLPKKGRWYRVSVGGFPTRREAENYANDLRKKGISDIFITRGPGAS